MRGPKSDMLSAWGRADSPVQDLRRGTPHTRVLRLLLTGKTGKIHQWLLFLLCLMSLGYTSSGKQERKRKPANWKKKHFDFSL